MVASGLIHNDYDELFHWAGSSLAEPHFGPQNGVHLTALEEDASLFEKLVQSAPDGVLIVDRQGEIVLANRQATTIFGYTTQELVGKPVDMLVPEAVRSAHQNHRDGYSVATKLVTLREMHEIPIVAVTSYAMAGDRERIMEAGCTSYIEKPINPETFVTEVQKHPPEGRE